MAIISTHLGVINETEIDNMSFVLFEDILRELNYKLTFEAVSNYAGNGFCEKSWDLIMEHHPLLSKHGEAGGESSGLMQLANFLGGFGQQNGRKK